MKGKVCELKICGITRTVDAEAAAEAGADDLGFVCVASSPRFVAPEKLPELSRAAGKSVRKVGVFRNASRDDILRAVESGKLDVVQLHGTEPEEFAAALSGETEVWKAFSLRTLFDVERAAAYPASRILCDSAGGGSGLTCDWTLVRELVLRGVNVALAGGITPENALAAWKSTGCRALDVSSGVESSPGVKDMQKMLALVSSLRNREVWNMQNDGRLKRIFELCRREDRGALAVYLTCGCPDLRSTAALLDAAVGAGADIVELGVPSAESPADGEVIRKASLTALRRGVGLPEIFDFASEVRQRHPELGLVLFSYGKVLKTYRTPELAGEMLRCGIDGLLAPDASAEEELEWSEMCRNAGRDFIYFVRPSDSPERKRSVASRASGFLYQATVDGKTGVRPGPDDAALSAVREMCGLSRSCPVCAGFGISTEESARKFVFEAGAAGVISGSAVMRAMTEENIPPATRIARASEIIAGLARGVRGGKTA